MTVRKIPLITPIALSSVPNHKSIKSVLMDLINSCDARRIVDENCNTLDITRCDYDMEIPHEDFVENPRPWVDYLRPHLVPVIQEIHQELGFDTLKVHKIWFQQYETESIHGWHMHTDAQWTSVYYLDLPDESPRTEILNPFTQNDIQTLEIKEGDVVMFPSYVIHQAPRNKGVDTKTIISWNSDADIRPGYEVQ